jgi:hypothetical protein
MILLRLHSAGSKLVAEQNFGTAWSFDARWHMVSRTS